MKSSFFLLISAFALAGCSSSETIIDEPVKESTLKYDFVVEQNYQAVYRKILKQGRDCIKPGLTAQMVVHGELFNDIKAADITVVLYGIFSQYPHLQINIEAIGTGKTKISVSNKLHRWNTYAKAVKTWVDGNSTRCAVSE